jgi:hypothetical protein
MDTLKSLHSAAWAATKQAANVQRPTLNFQRPSSFAKKQEVNG